MKHSFLMLFIFMSVLISSAWSCSQDEDFYIIENNNPMANGKIKITVHSQVFSATLMDNSSAKAFKKMLPLTINMTELNGDEKYYDFPNNLPTNSSNPGTTKKGDLMLFGSKTFVLFYKTHSTSYSYTKLGAVDDTTVLAAALGSGNATVTIELG